MMVYRYRSLTATASARSVTRNQFWRRTRSEIRRLHLPFRGLLGRFPCCWAGLLRFSSLGALSRRLNLRGRILFGQLVGFSRRLSLMLGDCRRFAASGNLAVFSTFSNCPFPLLCRRLGQSSISFRIRDSGSTRA